MACWRASALAQAWHDAAQHARQYARVQHGQCLAYVGRFSLPENLAGLAAGRGITQSEHVRETP